MGKQLHWKTKRENGIDKEWNNQHIFKDRNHEMKFLYKNYIIIISEGLTCNEGQAIFRNGTQVDADGWCCHLKRDFTKIKFGED